MRANQLVRRSVGKGDGVWGEVVEYGVSVMSVGKCVGVW